MIAFDHMQTETPEGDHYDVTVIGVGGAGSNVIDRLALDGMGEAEIVCMNTDIRALSNSMANRKVQLGRDVTKGLGAGGDPELGLEVAEASEDEIWDVVQGRDIIFICAGLGGGTGSGTAPYVARLAREAGAFVVVFAIMPFGFEGRRRRSQADDALERLSEAASALLTFENGRMGELVLPKEGIQAAFAAADEVIGQSVRAVTGIVLRPGLIRIGMDDLIRALENDESRCLFGYGEATGENRAQEALSAALKSPLLERGVLLSNSRNVLVHVTGGKTMTLIEVELLMTELGKQIGDDAQILFGTGHDPKLGDRLAVTVISSLAQVVEPVVEVMTEIEPEAIFGVESAIEEATAEVVGTPDELMGYGRSNGDELELDDVSADRAPKMERGVAAAALADIEEVVAETLLDLGMDEPNEAAVELVAEEDVVAEFEEFVEIEMEEESGEREGEPFSAVESDSENESDTGAEEVDGDAETVAGARMGVEEEVVGDLEEEVGPSPAEEVVFAEIEEEISAVEVSNEREVAGPAPENAVDEQEDFQSEVAFAEEMAAVEEKIEAIAAAMGGTDQASALAEPVSEQQPRELAEATGGEDEEAEMVNEVNEEFVGGTDEEISGEGDRPATEVIGEELNYFVPVDEVGRDVDEEEVQEATGALDAGVVAEREEAVEEEDRAFGGGVVAEREEAVEEEDGAPGSGVLAEMEEAVEEEDGAPGSGVVAEREEAVEEEDRALDRGVLAEVAEEVVDEVQASYTPSAGYGKLVEDEAVEEYEHVEADAVEEEEPVLAMAADTGHADPAMAPAVGPRVGLVEPKPSDPSGQGMLELDPGSRGRFDNSSPTVIDGEDLDVPTFLRKRKTK